MKALSESSKSQFHFALVAVIIVGTAYGVVTVIALGFDTKWTLSLIVFLVCLPVFLLIKEKQKVAIVFLVLTMSLSLDFYLVRFESLPYRLPIPGLRITLFNLVFFYLFLSWVLQLLRPGWQSVQYFPSFFLPFSGILIFFLLSSINSPLPSAIKFAYIWYAFNNLLIFLFFANTVKDEQTVKLLVIAIIFSGVFQSLLAIGQYVTGSTFGLEILGESEKGFWSMKAGSGIVNRVSGTLGHPNRMSSVLGGILPLNLAMIFAPVNKRTYMLYIFSFGIMLVANFLTFSRGGLISFVIAGGICCYWCLSKRFGNRFLSALFMIAAFTIFIVTVITFIGPVRQRLFGSDYGSLATRLPLVQVALNMIKQKPFLGVGPGSFNAVSHQYDSTRQIISYSFPAPVHNEFLLIASEIGIPALILFLTVLAFTLTRLFQTAKSPSDSIINYLAIGFFCSWLGWCLHRMIATDYILLYNFNFFSIGVIYAMHRMTSIEKLNGKTEKVREKATKTKLLYL